MKKVYALLYSFIAVSIPLVTDAYSTEKVNGITWCYEVVGGIASVGYKTSGNGYTYYYQAIPTTTKGAVTIPATLGGYPVKQIGTEAFKGCLSITHVTIPNIVTDIGTNSFNGCTNLTTVTIPNSVTNIRDLAFWNCWRLTNVSIPSNVTSIGNSVFSCCTSLTSVTLADGITSIGDSAFSSCTSLTSVMLPESIMSIGASTFSRCRSLTSVTLADGITSIGYGAFSGCTSLTDVTIPNTVTNIGSFAFNDCGSLTSVTIPEHVVNIQSYTFSGCTNLVSVTIPNGVTNIGDCAFSFCTNLPSIAIPDSVKMPYFTWQRSQFNRCDGLRHVVVPQDVCTNRLNLIFPSSYIAITNVVINDGVSNIGAHTFSNCLSLAWLTIPSSVTSVGTGAFYGCGMLKDVTIPQCVCATTLATIFPAGYKGITNIVVNTGVTEIAQRCFSGCAGLRSVTLPESVTSIRANAFENCSSIDSVHFLGDAPDIGSTIYYGTPRSLITYVPRGSIGWQKGVSSGLPETWPTGDSTARAIEYWDGNKTATPVVMPVDGTLFEDKCDVSITCATEGATIYFTTNGITPRLVEGNVYSSPIVIEGTVQIKAIAVAKGLTPSDSVAVTITKVDELTLPLAIGANGKQVETGGDASWSPVVDPSAPMGGMAARSGAIGENGESWMETVVVGAGTLSFWWRVSCVKDFDGTATWDYLVCESDGKEIARIDGNTAWVKQDVSFKTAGRHTVRWTYVKDSFYDEGDFEDCAWVQGVEWIPESGPDSGEELYSRDQIHALALGNLVIDVNVESQKARVGLYLKETADLGNPDWKIVPLSLSDLDIGSDGTIGVSVPATGNAAFYKIVVEEKP